MLNKLKESLKKLKESKIKPKGFFCNAFIMCEFMKLDEQNWKLDFYDNKTNTITSYTVTKTIIKEDIEDKILKNEKEEIKELILEEVNKNFKRIIEIYTRELINRNPKKIIIILQNPKIPIWNISFITSEYTLLNIKINAKTQEIITKNEESLLNMQAKQKN